MYYGNSGATNQQNPAGVWDSDYKGVWHLSEDPSIGAPQMQESTSNNFDGTSNGTMTSGDQVAGKTNGALDFDGSNDYIGAGNQTALNAGSAFTISGWINRTANSPTGIAGVIAGKWNGTGSSGWFLEVTDSDQGAANQIRFFVGGLSDTSLYSTTSTVSNSTWYYVTAVYNGSNKILYMNGSSVGSEASTGTPTTTTDAFQIGYDIASGATNNYFAGILDEVRVSNAARTADWVTTEYNNQSSPSTFYTVGTEQVESGTGDWYNSSWLYRKAIIIDEAQVAGSSDHTSFPVLVSITDTNLLAGAQADGDDILFTSADGQTKLDHEIESYNSGTGALVAWVRIPTLSYNTNTTIYMYYGNSGASTQQNATGVWDSNYVAVWHMNQASGTLLDSTANNNDVTAAGTPDYAQAGKTGTSINFDGSTEYFSGTITNIPTANTYYTIETWYNIDTTGNRGFVGWGAYGTTRQVTALRTNSSTGYSHYWWGDDHAPSQTISTGTWTYAAAQFDGTTRRTIHNATIYTNTPTGTHNAASTNFRIASTNSAEYFDGKLDEVRISRVGRSTDWLATSYNSQNSPSTFYSVGTEETEPTATPNPIVNTLGGQAAADANLVGHWKFDENTGTTSVTDSSGNSLTGTMNGSMTAEDWVVGKYGSALDFDGTDDAISLGTNSLLKFGSGNFTYAAWVKTSATAATDVFVGDSNNATAERMLYTGGANTAICFARDASGNGATATGTTTITNDVWHHLVCVRNGTSVYIYVDGKLEGTGTNGSMGSTDTTPSANVFIAKRDNASGLNFTGLIDDVRIYNDARTPGEIVSDMNAGHPLGGSPIGSQIAYWGLDEQQGQTANSRGFGSSMGGTFGATTAVSTDDPTWKTAADCKINGCLSFDGGDYVKTANDALNGISTQGSYTLWFKTSSTGESLMYSNEGYHGLYMNFSAQAGKITAFFDGSSAGNPSTTQTYNDNAWHHLAATNNGTTTKVYIDGVKVLDFAETFAAPSSTQPFVIGAQYTGATSFYTGSLDEVKAYTAALTESEIYIDKNAGSAVNAGTGTDEAAQLSDGAGNPPIAYWKLDDNTGTSAIDSSGNGNTGTLTNSPKWVTGKAGSAINVTSSNDHILVSGLLGLNTPTAQQVVTVSLWMKATTLSSDAEVISLNDNIAIRVTPTSIRGFYRTSGFSWSTTALGIALSTDRWYHITYVADPANSTQVIYVDGNRLESGTSSSAISYTAGNTYLGQHPSGGNQFNGILDDVKVYNYARTTSQVKYDYNTGGPLAYWKFDECTGTTVYNSTGYSDTSNGSYHGSITVGASGSNTTAGTCSTSGAWSNGSIGKFNSGFDFDGTDDYADFGNLRIIGAGSEPGIVYTSSNDYTVTGWFNRDTFTTDDTIFAKRNGIASTDVGKIVYIDDATDRLVFEQSNGTTEFQMESTTTFTTSGWNHFAIVLDRNSTNNTAIYINGQKEITTKTGSIGSTSVTNSVNVRVGTESDGGTPFDGKIDEIKYFVYPLSSTQITIDMNHGAGARFGPATGPP